jgi:hypothetical protein
MSSSHKTKDANPIPAENYYDFGQKSAALIGLLLTSDGEVTAFTCRRPAFDLTKSFDPMKADYFSEPLKLKTGTVSFTFTLAADKEGLLTIEPRGWPNVYELNRTHFLGKFNPFGPDEIPFLDKHIRGTNRAEDKPANRIFKGVFSYDPEASDPKQVATLTLIDVESRGQSLEEISISLLTDKVRGLAGGLLLALRVNVANFVGDCASLEFTGGHRVEVKFPGKKDAELAERLVLTGPQKARHRKEKK